MDGEEIGLVLARALEIRSKISDCIGRGDDVEVGEAILGRRAVENGGGDEEEEEEEAQSLVGIRDALDSLERQLAALQALQQQQRYERESILSQIDRSRMILLNKLKEYKGEDLEVLQEAAAFAGEKIEHDDGLLLPPYPSHLPDLFAWNDLYPNSQLMSNSKVPHNGQVTNSKHETNEEQNNWKPNTSKGFKGLLGLIAKSAITLVGVISILRLAGYQPMIKKWPIQVQALQLFGSQEGDRQQSSDLCPPGKVLVIEDGKARCLVKERVEVPFESDISSPDIKYGFG